jgi:hypothetical protein
MVGSKANNCLLPFISIHLIDSDTRHVRISLNGLEMKSTLAAVTNHLVNGDF